MYEVSRDQLLNRGVLGVQEKAALSRKDAVEIEERDRLGRFQPASGRLAPAANVSLFGEPSAHAECLRRDAEGGGRGRLRSPILLHRSD
jgi:hypothetical protein